MAMYNFNISSFADAERLYNNTKPIRGSKIVPLGDRRRKWERIVKVSPKCYALLNELHDRRYSSYNWYKTEEEQIAQAAVTWTLTDNNNSVVEFRNGDGDAAHTSRYSFLERCMPSRMRFDVDSGKQYVSHGGDRHYLPKDKDKTVVLTDRRTPRGAWMLTSKPHPSGVIRKRINKEAKKPYKEAITSYLEWVWTMTPILNSDFSWEAKHQARVGCTLQMNDYSMFKSALMDEAHEARTHMAVFFLAEYHDYLKRNANSTGGPLKELTDDPKKFRTRFNAWINCYAGFTESFAEFRG